MTRFLSHPDQSVLLADLANAGFVFKDKEGVTRQPEPMEVISHNGESCIWLGHVPLKNTPEYIAQYIANTSIDDVTLDMNGEIIIPTRFSTDFCANVTACEGHVFATETAEPAIPYNKFA